MYENLIDEEVNEMIHEADVEQKFAFRPAEKAGYTHGEAQSVKDGARGAEERALTSSENKSTKHIAKPMSISTRPSVQRC